MKRNLLLGILLLALALSSTSARAQTTGTTTKSTSEQNRAVIRQQAKSRLKAAAQARKNGAEPMPARGIGADGKTPFRKFMGRRADAQARRSKRQLSKFELDVAFLRIMSVSGDTGATIKQFEELLSRTKNERSRFKVYEHMAKVYLDSFDYSGFEATLDRAEKDLLKLDKQGFDWAKKGASRDRTQTNIVLNRTNLMLARAQQDEAIKYLTDFLGRTKQFDPHSELKIRTALACVLLKSGRYKEAQTAYQALVTKDLLKRGQNLQQKRRRILQPLMGLFMRSYAVRIGADARHLSLLQAQILVALEQIDAAVEVLDKSSPKAQAGADAYLGVRLSMGAIYQQAGRNQAALQEFNKVIAYNSTMVKPGKELGRGGALYVKIAERQAQILTDAKGK